MKQERRPQVCKEIIAMIASHNKKGPASCRGASSPGDQFRGPALGRHIGGREGRHKPGQTYGRKGRAYQAGQTRVTQALI